MRSNNNQGNSAGNYQMQSAQINYLSNYAELNHDSDYDEQEYRPEYYVMMGKYFSDKGKSGKKTSSSTKSKGRQ